jgi:eukaryotic-like serine/threonine-protein kinase
VPEPGRDTPSANSTLPLPATSSDVGRPSESEASWIGRVIAGRYALERVIGRGGMGFVFEGRHVAVGRRVAVKILRPEAARSAEAVARFHREARAAASIGHKRIVEVLDFGHGDDGAYLVMELLEGEDLSAIVRSRGALPVARAVGIARQVADGLRAAHAQGIVHRDLKSGNVFVSQRDGRDSVKILDFGVSKVLALDELDGEGPSTHQGALLGTPHTMAPEQCTDGRSVDHRADLYALGCILFEMLTGELPFTGATPVEVLYKHVHESPRRPSSLRADKTIPRALDDLVVRLLAKDRERRPPDAQSVLDAIDRIDLDRRGARRRFVVVALASLVVAFGVIAAARPSSHPPHAPRDAAAPVDVAPPIDLPVARDTAAEAAPQVATLTLVVTPVHATLRVDGALVASPEGVFIHRATRGDEVVVRAEAPGHLPREARFRLDENTTVRWALTASPSVRTERDPLPRTRPARIEDAGAAQPVSPDGLKTSPYHPH